MSAPTCRWCRLLIKEQHATQIKAGRPVGNVVVRHVHIGTGQAECADGLHAAEPVPVATAAPQVRCTLCRTWVPLADYADHWPSCPGPPVDGTSTSKRKARARG